MVSGLSSFIIWVSITLPGVSVGKKYIYIYICCVLHEVQYLSLGTYCSECLIVFCSLMLQWDHLVHKGCDIYHLLDC